MQRPLLKHSYQLLYIQYLVDPDPSYCLLFTGRENFPVLFFGGRANVKNDSYSL